MKTLTLSEALAITDDARCITTAQHPYKIVHTNKAWASLTKYKYAQAANKTPPELLHGPDTETAARDLLRAAVKSKQRVKATITNYARDGTPIKMTIDCAPVAGRTHFYATVKGEPITDGSVAPIPERMAEWTDPEPVSYKGRINGGERRTAKRTTDKVRLTDVLANTDDPIVLCEKEYPHFIMHPNEPWLEMCGYSAEEVEGRTNKILTGPDTDQGAIDSLLGCVRREEPSVQTLYNYKKGGIRFLNQVKTLPVYDENDELAAFMSMLQEIDEDSLMDMALS